MNEYKPSEMAKLILDSIREESKAGNLTSLDLLNIEKSAKHYAKQVQIARLRKEEIGIGSLVKFTDSRTGQEIKGTFVKLNQKRAIVRLPNFIEYTVPLSMLSAVDL